MKTEKRDSLLVLLLQAVGALAFICLIVAWNGLLTGLSLSVMWGWFVVPIFGLPALTVAQALGLALVASCFRSKTFKSDAEKEGWTTVAARAFFQPLTMWGLLMVTGWCLKRWFM